MCVAKGLTGGFLPLAATFATDRIHDAFMGGDRARAFFHGHSYTANPIACAAANASLQIFESEPVFERIAAIEKVHVARLPAFSEHPSVGDVRHIGTVAAIELNVPDAGYLSSLRPRLYKYFLKPRRATAPARQRRLHPAAVRHHARATQFRVRRDSRFAGHGLKHRA